MITQVQAGRYTVRGVSVGGIYTSLHVPEMHALFDVGLAARSTAAVRSLFLSHAHVDHVGALTTLLGIRALVGKRSPLRVYLPGEIAGEVESALEAWARLQRYDLSIHAVPMHPGDEANIGGDLRVRAFRTYHPVPSLGFQLFRRVKKLKREYVGRDGQAIRELKQKRIDIFDHRDYPEVAYATDTLAKLLDQEPSILKSRVLILECTFLDSRKSLEATRAGCHIHLDEILERADLFENEHLVLMHFSQIYKPGEVIELLDKRCPQHLRERIIPFVPSHGGWPG